MHLDFTGCFLTADQIRKLSSACKYTGSLQCFHLCMNPGLSEELTEEIRQLIKAGPLEPRTRLPPYLPKSGPKTLRQQDIIESLQLTQLVQVKMNPNLSKKLPVLSLEAQNQGKLIL